MTVTRDRRFPASLYRQGQEPDVRFTLANERTFLAWIRTTLAIIAAGVALELLGPTMHPTLRISASLVLLLTGVMLPAFAWIGWTRTERALRLGQPLPSSPIGLILGLAVIVSGALIVAAILLGD